MGTELPLVSVGMPVYNGERHLRPAIVHFIPNL